MELIPILIFIALIVYFIFNRIQEKRKEKFEDRDH